MLPIFFSMNTKTKCAKYILGFLFIIAPINQLFSQDTVCLFDELPFREVVDARELRFVLTGENEDEFIPKKTEEESFVEDLREDIAVKAQYLLEQIVYTHNGEMTEKEKNAVIDFQKREIRSYRGINTHQKNDIELARQGLITRFTDYRKALLQMSKDLNVTEVAGNVNIDLNTYRLFRCANSVRQWLCLYNQRPKNRKDNKLYTFVDLDAFVIDINQQLQKMLPDYKDILESMCKIRVIKEKDKLRPANEYLLDRFSKLAKEALDLKVGLNELRKKLKKTCYKKYFDQANSIKNAIEKVIVIKKNLLSTSQVEIDNARKGELIFAGFVDLSQRIGVIEKYMHSYKLDYKMVMQANKRQTITKERQREKARNFEIHRIKEAERVEREKKACRTRALQKQLRIFWQQLAAEEAENLIQEENHGVGYVACASAIKANPNKIDDTELRKVARKAKKAALKAQRLKNTRLVEESRKKAKAKGKKKDEPEIDWEKTFGAVGHLTRHKQSTLIGIYKGDVRFKPNEVIPFLKSLGGEIASNGGSQRTVTFVGSDKKLIKGIFHAYHGRNDEKGLRNNIRDILIRAGFLPAQP